MLKRILCAAVLLAFSLSVVVPVMAQPFETSEKGAKPFKILTSGKRITIQAKQKIQSVIVWTSNGHRLIEQKEINLNSYSFNISITEKVFFARVTLEDGKMYSEKFGVQ